MILEIILTCLKFAFAIFGVAMEDKKKTEAENQAFKIDSARIKAWADAVLLKLQADAKADSDKARDAWDKQEGDKHE